jgi:ribonuclease E
VRQETYDFMEEVDLPSMEAELDEPLIERDEADEEATPSRAKGEAPREDGKRRRRRRRRGSRDREPVDEAPPEEAAPSDSYELAPEEEDDFEPRPPRREPARGPARSRPPQREREREPQREREPAEIEDELDEGDDDAIDTAGHSGIPTWHDAIGVVVGANMEARARNPGGSRHPRGRGGRGRGGRGR